MGTVSGAALLAVLALSPIAACQSKAQEPNLARDAAPKALPTTALPTTALPATALQLPFHSSPVAQLEITQPGKEPVTLRASDGKWDIISPLHFPAKLPSVESMLAVLAEIEIVRRVAAQPEPKHRLGVDARVLVKATGGDGTERAFLIGASKSEETFVQRLGEEQVYAVRGACRRIFDISVDQLRAPAITKLDVTNIEGVRFVNASGTLELVPSKDEAMLFVEASPSISNFNDERASKNVAVLANLFAKGFVDPPVDRLATGLFGEETARIEVLSRGEAKPLTVYIGARTKNGRLHLRTSDSEQLYLVSGHLGSSLVPKPTHFERTDSEMQALKAEVPSANDVASDHAVEHKHGNARPTLVPPELMNELRALAAEQRD